MVDLRPEAERAPRRLRRWLCRRCSNRKPVRNHVRKPPWWRHLTRPWRAGSGELAFYSVVSGVVAVDVEGHCGAETLGGGPAAWGPCEEHHRGRRLPLPPPVAGVFGRHGAGADFLDEQT